MILQIWQCGMLLSGQQFNTEAANTTQIPELGKKQFPLHS